MIKYGRMMMTMMVIMMLTYLIFVSNAGNAVSVKFLAERKNIARIANAVQCRN